MKVLFVSILISSVTALAAFAQNADLERGKKLIEAEQSAEAIKFLDKCVAATNAKIAGECLQLRAIAHARTGNQARADQDIARAARLTPNDANVYFNRARLYYWREDSNRALPDFDRAIRRDPQNAEAFYLRGIAHSDTGATAKAISDFTRVLRLDPQKHYAVLLRGAQYAALKNYAAAIADFAEYIKLAPGEADGYFARASAYQKSGDKSKAKTDYEAVLKIDANNEEATENLKNLKLTATEVEMWAEELLRNENGYAALDFLEHYPEYAELPRIALLRPLIYFSIGDLKKTDAAYQTMFDRALKTARREWAAARRVSAQSKADALPGFRLASAGYEATLDFNRIRTNIYNHYQTKTARNPEKIVGYAQADAEYQQLTLVIADFYLKNNDTENALDFYSKVINRNPKNAAALRARAAIYRRQNKIDWAIADENKIKSLAGKTRPR